MPWVLEINMITEASRKSSTIDEYVVLEMSGASASVVEDNYQESELYKRAESLKEELQLDKELIKSFNVIKSCLPDMTINTEISDVEIQRCLGSIAVEILGALENEVTTNEEKINAISQLTSDSEFVSPQQRLREFKRVLTYLTAVRSGNKENLVTLYKTHIHSVAHSFVTTLIPFKQFKEFDCAPEEIELKLVKAVAGKYGCGESLQPDNHRGTAIAPSTLTITGISELQLSMFATLVNSTLISGLLIPPLLHENDTTEVVNPQAPEKLTATDICYFNVPNLMPREIDTERGESSETIIFKIPPTNLEGIVTDAEECCFVRTFDGQKRYITVNDLRRVDIAELESDQSAVLLSCVFNSITNIEDLTLFLSLLTLDNKVIAHDKAMALRMHLSILIEQKLSENSELDTTLGNQLTSWVTDDVEYEDEDKLGCTSKLLIIIREGSKHVNVIVACFNKQFKYTKKVDDCCHLLNAKVINPLPAILLSTILRKLKFDRMKLLATNAIFDGQLFALKKIVETTCNPNFPTITGGNLISLACRLGQTDIVSFLVSQSRLVVSSHQLALVIDNGHASLIPIIFGTKEVDVNSSINGHFTSLHYSLLGNKKPSIDVIKTILGTKDIELDKSTTDGKLNTVLHLCCINLKGQIHVEVLKILVEAIPVSILDKKNANGMTPIALIKSSKASKEILKQAESILKDSIKLRNDDRH